MSVRVVLPNPLQEMAGGARSVEVANGSRNVRDALDAVGARYPGVRNSILTEEGQVRPHVNLFLDGEDVRWTGGLDTPLPETGELLVLRAVSGG